MKIIPIGEIWFYVWKNINFYQMNLSPISGLQTWLNKNIDFPRTKFILKIIFSKQLHKLIEIEDSLNLNAYYI